ncbi:MAG: endolytic transglycosylase MltG, partial [Candidatus Sungiibacteriota bacterium]
VLWKRLNAGIPLQVDATIAYAKLQITNYKLQKNIKISAVDKKINSPYNTYKYRGLPAGPIANPGLSAIRAAIYPKQSPYLYYLSAPDGRTIFSRTLDEHNAAKIKYLQ